jgi:hypothetical protein
MNNDTSKSGGNFLSAFIIGALIGAAVVFFLGTKRGKKILKIISEKGIDNVSTLLREAEKTIDLDETSEEEEPFLQKKIIAKEKVTEEMPKTRRFFKGISRHN